MHRTSSRFWKCFDKLPSSIRKTADENFELLKNNPYHPSLHFKKIGSFWSVRIGLNYRALAIEDGEDFRQKTAGGGKWSRGFRTSAAAPSPGSIPYVDLLLDVKRLDKRHKNYIFVVDIFCVWYLNGKSYNYLFGFQEENLCLSI